MFRRLAFPPIAWTSAPYWVQRLVRPSRHRIASHAILISALLAVGTFILALYRDWRASQGGGAVLRNQLETASGQLHLPADYAIPAAFVLTALAIAAWQNRRELAAAVDTRTRALTDALNERDQLLKEVHHRVKSNMQIISSLIRMQDQVNTSPEETIRRIQALALVHDVVVVEGQFARVDLAALARRLCDTLAAIKPETIVFQLRVEPVPVGLDLAMPFALILSEVVTNAIKHAFRDMEGTIAVTITHRGEVAKLSVHDDGTGYNPELDGHGFGQTLIKLLGTQLDAMITIDRTEGTTFSMTFPVDKTETGAETLRRQPRQTLNA